MIQKVESEYGFIYIIVKIFYTLSEFVWESNGVV